MLHPQIGNQGIYAGQDRNVNFVMEQVYTGAGRRTCKAEPSRSKEMSRCRKRYSGVVENLTPLYPIGDYNSNFVVDTADYTAWRDILGQEVILPNEGPTPGHRRPGRLHRMEEPLRPKGSRCDSLADRHQIRDGVSRHEQCRAGSATPWDLRDGEGLDAYRTDIDKVMGVAPAGTSKGAGSDFRARYARQLLRRRPGRVVRQLLAGRQRR